MGLALRHLGWHVTGSDADPASAQRALELGAIDAVGLDPLSELSLVAAPVSAISTEVRRALAHTAGVVTDVGSVKASVVAEVDDPRFVGGHPMAGSEQLGVDGASADLFEGAVWVLTPVAGTDPDHFATVDAMARSLGADVVALDPNRHDALVAVVSHVPHLTAAALMTIADERSDEHAALLRLAAGGFRDMTRIAAGSPSIWPDICAENRDAILEILDAFMIELGEVRTIVANGDRPELMDRLERSREARINLPTTAGPPSELVELLVTVKDRPGELARITAMATEMQVNIYDIEIAHSAERPSGLVIMLVDLEKAQPMVDELLADGYSVAQRRLG